MDELGFRLLLLPATTPPRLIAAAELTFPVGKVPRSVKTPLSSRKAWANCPGSVAYPAT
jgi:hypothetical protein